MTVYMPIIHQIPVLRSLLVCTMCAVGVLPSKSFAQEDSSRLKIAVLDVQAKGQVDPDLPGILGLLMSSRLAQSGVFDVITQEDVRQMVGYEKMKSSLGCELDASCLAEIGAALGASYLLTSQVAKVGSTYILSLSLIDIDGAKGIGRDTIKTKSQDELITELERRVDRLVAPLQYDQSGQLAILCPEPGALVEVDGKALGTTPLPIQDLPAGPHRVVVTKDGFFRYTRDVDVLPGDNQELNVSLEAVRGTKTNAGAAQEGSKDVTEAKPATDEPPSEQAQSESSILSSPLFYGGLATAGLGGLATTGGLALSIYFFAQLSDKEVSVDQRENARLLFFSSAGVSVAGAALLLAGAGLTATSFFLE